MSKFTFEAIFEAQDLQMRAQRIFFDIEKLLKSNFHQNQLPKPKTFKNALK